MYLLNAVLHRVILLVLSASVSPSVPKGKWNILQILGIRMLEKQL